MAKIQEAFIMTKPPAGQLLQAVKARDLDRARNLLQQGANPNETDPETGGTVLHTSVECERTGAMTKLLLEFGAHVDARTEGGKTTAVMYAARANTEALRFLLEKNPDLSIEDGIGRNAMAWAKNSGNHAAITLIKKAIRKQADDAAQKMIADFHQVAVVRQSILKKLSRKTIFKGPQ